MFRRSFLLVMCIFFLIPILAGCTNSGGLATQPPLPTDTQIPPVPTLEPAPTKISAREPLDAAEVKAIASAFATIADRQVEAWNAYDFDAMRTLYTDEIRFVDATFGDYITGIDSVLEMARGMSEGYSSMRRQVIDHFIGLEDSVATYDYWGFEGYTPDDPMLWVFQLRTNGDRISNWTLLEGLDAAERSNLGTTTLHKKAKSLLSRYQSVWSSGDLIELADLYSDDAVRTDSLFRENLKGKEAISSFAESFFAWYPGAQWRLLHSFGEWQGLAPITGGIYSIKITDNDNQPCEILEAVLLKAPEGKITQENLYYQPDSLIQCGWAK